MPKIQSRSLHRHHAKHHHPGADRHHDDHDHYGNPKDLAAYLTRLEGPERSKWQKPDAVVRALEVRPGQTIAEIGAGPGYFTLRIAKAVGKKGRILAAEVEPKMIALLRDRLARKKVTNVTPILGLPNDPLFPEGLADQILIINTFHHFPSGVAYLRGLKRFLKPKGRLINIDFHARELQVGPPVGEKISREAFINMAGKAGYAVVSEHSFLAYQYFLVLAA